MLAQVADPLVDPLPFLRVLFDAVRNGNGTLAASALLVVVVFALRLYGPKLHALLSDHTLADKALYFLFETRPGGWLLNLLTSIAGGTGSAVLVGVPLSWELAKPIIGVSIGGAALYEFASDLWRMFQAWRASKTAPVLVPPVP